MPPEELLQVSIRKPSIKEHLYSILKMHALLGDGPLMWTSHLLRQFEPENRSRQMYVLYRLFTSTQYSMRVAVDPDGEVVGFVAWMRLDEKPVVLLHDGGTENIMEIVYADVEEVSYDQKELMDEVERIRDRFVGLPQNAIPLNQDEIRQCLRQPFPVPFRSRKSFQLVSLGVSKNAWEKWKFSIATKLLSELSSHSVAYSRKYPSRGECYPVFVDGAGRATEMFRALNFSPIWPTWVKLSNSKKLVPVSDEESESAATAASAVKDELHSADLVWKPIGKTINLGSRERLAGRLKG